MQNYTRYLFVLGRNPDLSITELVSYLKTYQIEFEVNHFYEDVLDINIESAFKPDNAINNLAGIIKIAIVYLEATFEDIFEKLEQSDFYIENDDKINYALDFYGKGFQKEAFQSFFKEKFKLYNQRAFLKNFPPHVLAKAIKDRVFIDIILLKESNVKSISSTKSMKYVKKSAQNTRKNKKSRKISQPTRLVDDKIKKNEIIIIARTIAVHDIDEEKKRYDKRPFVDESISTSTRIARMLINLAGVKNDQLLLDPFCGLGTVMQEALIIGIESFGSEINETRVKQCKVNLDWLKSNYAIKTKFEVRKGDAKNVSVVYNDMLNKFDAIVSEPELGPLLKQLPDIKTASIILNNLQSIYRPLFKGAAQLLKSGGKLVIILPRIQTSTEKTKEIPYDFLISGTSLKLYNPTIGLPSSISQKIPLIYKEEWHKLERLIYIFEKK
jgi:tRNA G10  N-methylase Trm11